MELSDGTFFTMEEFLKETKRQNYVIFVIGKSEKEYFLSLTAEEQIDYMKKHSTWDGKKKYMIFEGEGD